MSMLEKIFSIFLNTMPPASTQLPSTVFPDEPVIAEKDMDKIIRTIYGEARGEPVIGQIGIAHLIKNRMEDKKKRYGSSFDKVLRPSQFNTWSDADVKSKANLKEVMALKVGSKKYKVLREMVEGVFSGKYADPTHGSKHFYNPKFVRPGWAKKATASIRLGNHRFLVGVDDGAPMIQPRFKLPRGGTNE